MLREGHPFIFSRCLEVRWDLEGVLCHLASELGGMVGVWGLVFGVWLHAPGRWMKARLGQFFKYLRCVLVRVLSLLARRGLLSAKG